MEFLEKYRALVALVLALVVALAIVVGTCRSVDGIKNTLADEFNKKSESGEIVSASVKELQSNMKSFAAEYKLALGECEELTIVNDCVSALNCVNGTTPFVAKVNEAESAAKVMKNRLEKEDKYTLHAEMAFKKMNEELISLRGNDAYNAAAKRYNKIASTFVGKIFGLGQALEF